MMLTVADNTSLAHTKSRVNGTMSKAGAVEQTMCIIYAQARHCRLLQCTCSHHQDIAIVVLYCMFV